MDISTATAVGKKLNGSQCTAFGCQKRKKTITSSDYTRSDSEGSDDEESVIKRQFPRTFHRFPSDERLKKKWIVNIQRKGWLPTKASVICSDHFAETYMYRLGRRVTLREGAVPTRFKKVQEDTEKGLESPPTSSARPGIIIPYVPDTVTDRIDTPPHKDTNDHNYNAPPRKIQCSVGLNTASMPNSKEKRFKSCRLKRSKGKTLDEAVKRCMENRT